MERVALITVEASICLRSETHRERPVLVVSPFLAVPPGGWKEREEMVTILKPDGREQEAIARFSLFHNDIRDGKVVPGLRVSIQFLDMTSADVPDGSKILVSRETGTALLPKTVA